jgi:hypothetical protein
MTIEQERLAIAEMLARVTIPILYEESGYFGIAGTGTLFRINDRIFMVTAGHTIDDLPIEKWSFSANPKKGKIYTLGRLDHHRPLDRHLDVAVLELMDDFGTKILQDGWSFLTLDQISLPHEDADFFISGYPSALAESQLAAVRGTFFALGTSRLRSIPSNAKPPVDPNIDYFFDAGRNVFSGYENLDVHGMSGSPVGMFRSVEDGVWMPQDAIRIVGVQTAVRKHQYLRAISWATVAMVLEKVEAGLAGDLKERLAG